MSRWLADLLWRWWYPVLTRLTGDSRVSFLNYGYAEGKAEDRPLALAAEDEADRACIQLYQRVVGAVDIKGLCVLEMSCGHGGGAAYIARAMKPKSMHGVDRNERAVALCNQRHKVDGLTFSQGNAMALDFADGTFDAVVNIEASHCYPDVSRFFDEVVRVLRPGGHFLFADFRAADPGGRMLEKELKQSGLEVVRYDDISAQVVRGMQLNTEKYLNLIQKLVPRLLRKPVMGFAGVKGSAIYRELESGVTVYAAYHLRKRR